MRLKVRKLVDGTTEVDIRTLPDGRSCIHWLQECADGPIRIQGHAQLRQLQGSPEFGTYRVACNEKQTTVTSQKRGNVRYLCMTTGDMTAVTCPKCIASPAMQVALSSMLGSDNEAVRRVAEELVQSFARS